MQDGKSLREWAIEKNVWEIERWKAYLEEGLVPLYKKGCVLNSLYKFLKSDKICGMNTLADIEDEILRNKIRTAIYGGIENPETSFAKFMYDKFGICAENAPSFEDSVKSYENSMDDVKISINSSSWISKMGIEGNLVNESLYLIQSISKELGIRLSALGIQDSYPYLPLVDTQPDSLLPQAGKKPDELLSIIDGFIQDALNLSIGINPFTTFVLYSRAIPLTALMQFLHCDVNQIKKLADFLGLDGYSMIDGNKIQLPTNGPHKAFLLRREHSISDRILELQTKLLGVDQIIKDSQSSFTSDALNQIHVNFDPWGDYEPIFTFLKDLMKNNSHPDQPIDISLQVENGRIFQINYYQQLSNRIELRDFLMKMYPVISVGLVDQKHMNELHFNPPAVEWIKKVVKNEGKT